MLIPLSPPPADSIWQAQSFNLGTAGAKIFSGTAKEEFGYTVQQVENNQGKWYEFLSSHKKTSWIKEVSVSLPCFFVFNVL